MRLHYFDQLNPKSGELCDDELDNVAGGCSDDKTDEPQKYYNAFTDGMKVKSGNPKDISVFPDT